MPTIMLVAMTAFVLALGGAAVLYAMWLRAGHRDTEAVKARVSDYDERPF